MKVCDLSHLDIILDISDSLSFLFESELVVLRPEGEAEIVNL